MKFLASIKVVFFATICLGRVEAHQEEDFLPVATVCERSFWELAIDKEIVKIANPNQLCEDERLIHLVARNASAEVFAKFLEIYLQVDIHARDVNGNTPLIRAAEKGNPKVVEMLINAGADVNASRSSGYTALIAASEEEGHPAVVEMLINAGAEIDASNHYGYTTLIIASKYGHLKIVEMLINAGSDVNIESDFGYTALSLASKYGNLKVVEMLIDAGAELKFRK